MVRGAVLFAALSPRRGCWDFHSKHAYTVLPHEMDREKPIYFFVSFQSELFSKQRAYAIRVIFHFFFARACRIIPRVKNAMSALM